MILSATTSVVAFTSTVVATSAVAAPTCCSCPDLVITAAFAAARSRQVHQGRGTCPYLVLCAGTDCTYPARWRSLLLESIAASAIIAGHSFTSPTRGNRLTEHSEKVVAAP